MSKGLSVFYVVKNGQDTIKDSITSIKSIANEIIVVDLGSVDSTVSICRKLGCIVYRYKFDGDSSKVNNFAKSKCKKDYVLYLEQNEIISNDSLDLVSNLISNKSSKGSSYYFNIKETFTDWNGGSLSINSKNINNTPQLRLFPNKLKIKFAGTTKSTVDSSIMNMSSVSVKNSSCSLIKLVKESKDSKKSIFSDEKSNENYCLVSKESAQKNSIGKCAIVMVVFNAFTFAKECYDNIINNTDCEYSLYIVNNGSVDERVHEYFSSLENINYIKHGENLGVAKGRNVGISEALKDKSNKFICLLDSDTRVSEEWLFPMVEFLHKNKKSAMVGPITNSCVGHQKLVRNEWVGKYDKNEIISKSRTNKGFSECSFLDRFCQVFRRGLINKVGMLDESFGLIGWEEVDFCKRLVQSECKMHIAGSSYVYHNSHVSTRFNGMSYTSIVAQSSRAYNAKWNAIEKARKEVVVEDAVDSIGVTHSSDDDGTSIIVLTYNNLAINRRFFESLQEHTNNYELIVIDNGSTDGTVDYLKSLLCIDKLVFNKVNQGVIKARNVGLRLATKDYMVCLDNDQIVRSNWLVRLRREMALGYDFVGVEAWEMSARHLHPKKRHIIKRSGIKIDYVGAGGCLMKRSVLEDIGIFDERFGMAYYEDPDLCYRAKEAGYKIGWYHRPIINHLEHQTLIHGQKDFKHNDELSSSHAFFKEKVANKIKGQIYTECSLYEDVESVIEDVPCHNGMITLCMAVKNRSSRAYKSIQSIVNEETLRYFNFVIVEDISSDMLDLKAFKYRDKINHYIVDTDGPWNKSKLLNYGFKRHVGEYASVWDADFVFPKEFLSKYLKTLNNIDFSKKYLRIKCTETHNTERRGVKFNKGDLYGGFFTFSYDQFVGVRGYDERFTKWGFEDLDFNKRICGKYGALEHVVSERGLVYHFSHDDMRDMANLNFNEKMMNDNINNKNYIVNPNEFGEIEKGINRSDTLVVMCNGPSLREVDFNDLNGYDTFGMNGAYRYYYEHNWWPTYFGCFDFLVTESHKKSYVNMMTDKGIPIKEYFLLSKISNSKKLKTLDINGDLYSFSDRLSTFGNGGNTGSNCCQVGICLGYKRIILLGADCNYKEVVDGASKKSNYLVMDETPESNPNYFFDSYQRSGDAYNFPQSAKFHMPAWESLARFAESKGVDIVNCSRESKLECFRKADLKDEILINEKVNVDVAVDKKIKILMYTDSRGDNISADKNYDHFGVRLSEIYDVDMHLCTEKWTTTLDFLKLTKSVDMSKYDCVILYTGIVEWSPRLQESALNDLYRGRKGIAGKRDMFDMVFGKNDAESYLKTCLADNYEGKPSNNMYSTRMLRDSLLPALNKIDNLIWISGNKINTEWRGNYWKDRPVNMPITELYSNILSSKLDYVIDNMEWSYDDVQKYTFDNIHPNKLGSDIIYNKIIDKIGFIDSIGGFK